MGHGRGLPGMMEGMRPQLAPAIDPEPGWTPVSPFPAAADTRSYVTGDPTGARLRVAYFRRKDDDHLLARAWFGPEAEGPPGVVHGGAIAAVLDEAMGGVCWLNQHRVVAARISVTFLRMIPLGLDASVDAWIDLVEGRKITTRARLLDRDGGVLAESDGLFVVLREEVLQTFGRATRV